MAWLTRIKNMIISPPADDDAFREKRAAPRISCFLEAELLLDGGRIAEATIIALEATGMRFITPMKLAKGQVFSARLMSSPDLKLQGSFSFDPVPADVVWCRQKKGFPLYYAGVRFADDVEKLQSTWVFAILGSHGITAETDARRRRSLRVVTSLPIKIYYLDKKGHKTFLSGLAHDIGLGGVKVNLLKDPGEGKDMKIHIGPYRQLPLLECHGRLKRSAYSQRREDYTLGLEFLELDEEQMKLLGRYIMALLKESFM